MCRSSAMEHGSCARSVRLLNVCSPMLVAVAGDVSTLWPSLQHRHGACVRDVRQRHSGHGVPAESAGLLDACTARGLFPVPWSLPCSLRNQRASRE